MTSIVVGESVTTLIIDTRVGPPGSGGGGGAAFLHTQSVAALVWTINHNLGVRPNVELRGNAGDVFHSNVVHTTVNQVVVTHAYPIAGSAYFTL